MYHTYSITDPRIVFISRVTVLGIDGQNVRVIGLQRLYSVERSLRHLFIRRKHYNRD